jgi:hypothetical protein
VSLPPKGEARERWLTRKEAAALIWHCWRYREKQTIHSGSSRGETVRTDRRPLKHIARFILIGLYTGTRAGAIASASPYAEPGHSHVDLEQGIFYRKPIGKRATKKRQTPAPVARRLLAHLRRWRDRKLMVSCFVEFRGKPIASVKRGFKTAVGLARLPGKVTPHTFAPYRRDLVDAARRAYLGSRRVPRNVPGSPPGHLWSPSSRLPTRRGSGNRPKGPVRFGGRLDHGSKSDEKSQ